MEALRPTEVFGEVHVPPITNRQLTADYRAWVTIQDSSILMYPTVPDTDESVEQTGLTITIGIGGTRIEDRTEEPAQLD